LLRPAARPLAVAIVVACVLVTAGLGAWFWHETRTDWVDAVVGARLQAGLRGHPHLLAVLVWPGAPVPVTAIAATLALVCALRRRYRAAVFVVVSVVLAAVITERLLKPLIGRTFWSTLSFPSGHVTGVVALATVVTVLLAAASGRVPRPLRLALAVTAFLMAAAVAVGVVGAGMHYFTDTIAGAAVGTGTVLLTALALDALSFSPPHGQHAVDEDRPMADSRSGTGVHGSTAATCDRFVI
jgi:membrane-associated phospholipid phosphatase